MPKLLFARTLQDRERQDLERLLASDDSALRQRALIILLSSEEGYRVPEIAPMVGLHVDKVRKWIARFNRAGTKGLQPVQRKPGPRGKFSASQRRQIREIATTPPRRLGELRTVWTLESLRIYLHENGVVDEISRESLRQILIREKVNWQRTRIRSAQPTQWLSTWQSARPS